MRKWRTFIRRLPELRRATPPRAVIALVLCFIQSIAGMESARRRTRNAHECPGFFRSLSQIYQELRSSSLGGEEAWAIAKINGKRVFPKECPYSRTSNSGDFGDSRHSPESGKQRIIRQCLENSRM